MTKMDDAVDRSLLQKIAKTLDESKSSNSTHIRKIKELLVIRSKSQWSLQFTAAFCKALTPIFHIQHRSASVERVIRFVSAFACSTEMGNDSIWEEFLEEFLKFLLIAAVASSKAARLRACQIISEIIMRLPDDAEVSNTLWDEVIESMKIRVTDKVPGIRTFAVRALSRFINDLENNDILNLLLGVLLNEQSADVRKAIVFALPPSNATALAIIDCTLDVSESVRKAAYYVLVKFPLQSLSIKQRNIILRRGLSDRSLVVSNECFRLMKDEWFFKCCNGDPVELLKFLDVETYESVGETVVAALLKNGFIKLHSGQSVCQYLSSSNGINKGMSEESMDCRLMEPEFSLFLKTVCKHLHKEAEIKGSDAAATMGTEAAVYAAEASDNNDLLERILPATVSDYIVLVKAHIDAGANYRFASRQLLLLGAMLDFSDSTNRKVASTFVLDLLYRPLDHEVDDEGNKIVVGDGITLGGDKEWSAAVASLALKVHASAGEFEEVLLRVVDELARPCRERTADYLHWMHTLAVAGLLLEHARSFFWLQGKAIEPDELLHSLLLPGAEHFHFYVQRVAVRCLGLFGLIEKKPSSVLVTRLRMSFAHGLSPISIMACKALIDLGMWHGPQEVDRALLRDYEGKYVNRKMGFNNVNFSEIDENSNIELLDLLYAGFENDCGKSVESIEKNETVLSVLGEGFAKLLLLSENYPSLSSSLHPLLLAKLIFLYFSNDTKDLDRLKQCLSVFFEHYPSLSADHKIYLSKAFIPVMRSMWPGVYGNAGGSPVAISNMRKRAIQASRFMVQTMQAPLYQKNLGHDDENGSVELPETGDGCSKLPLECSMEGLAIRIAVEVASFFSKKSPAEKSYVAALCRVLVLLHFHSPDQEGIRLLRLLLIRVVQSISADRELVKELRQMVEQLKPSDQQQEDELLPDQAHAILGRLELDFNFDVDACAALPETPVPPRSAKPSHSKRRTRPEEASSEEETPRMSDMRTVTGPRSQRASKTAALSRMTADKTIKIDEYDDEDLEEGSDMTSSEEDSEDFDGADE